MEKKAKIIATLGPAIYNETKLKQLVKLGVDAFRINFSHETKNISSIVKRIRKVERSTDKKIALIADLQGVKLRVGKIKDNVQKIKFNQKLIVHCFTGNLSELEDYLKRDFYIGITGWVCDLKRGLELRECINHIPQDKLLIETDSPYLSPRKKIRRNEPKFLIDVAEEVATLRQETKESIIKSSYENSLNFFNLRR